MFSWGKAVLTALSILSSLIAWMRERKMIKAAEDKVLRSVLQDQLRLIKNAERARMEADASNANVANTDSLPNDGFRRD